MDSDPLGLVGAARTGERGHVGPHQRTHHREVDAERGAEGGCQPSLDGDER
jgi:hypothetical protein